MKRGRMRDLIEMNVSLEFQKNWSTPSWPFIPKIDQKSLKVTFFQSLKVLLIR